MELILLTIISILILTVFIFRYKKDQQSLNDSALKQRRVLNYNEQVLLNRLSSLLPQYTVLAKVSYNALLTTKYGHTRHKFNTLSADFVVLNEHYQVVAIISLYDPVWGMSQQLKSGQYEDRLLELGGYKVLRYIGVPDEQRLREDLHVEEISMAFA